MLAVRSILLAATCALAALPAAATAQSAPAQGSAGHSDTMHARHMAARAALDAALADPRREADRARDAARHPVETLAFFQVWPGMKVVDYMPAGGWYTRVLVPYLGAQGQYIGINPAAAMADNEGFRTYAGRLNQSFADAAPGWSLNGAPFSVASSDAAELAALDGTIDRVLIFREMHNLFRNGVMHHELTRLRRLLKDDGMLGIVQHRARPWASAAYTDGSKGYMRERDVIALVEAHGFELVGTSEINANPRDTADYPRGVWELAPAWGTKREELRAVGESDRMTLLFRKRS